MIFIENLITLIPEILWILISGYLYLKVFDFVTYEKDTKNYEYIFLKSVVCGTVLCNTVGTLTNMLISPWDNIVFISSVTLLAFCASKIFDSVFFRNIFKKIKINRTFNKNIWHDIMDKEHTVWADIRSKTLKRHYYGEIVLIEDFEKYPRIVLSRYTIYDKDNEVIEDYDNDPTKRIFIDTSLYDDIRLTYHKDSKNII